MTFDQPFNLMGGKWNLAPLIVSRFPPHHCFLEVFGGSLAVLLNKQPSPVEVVSDIDSNIVNFFLQLRDNPEALRYKVENTPYAREVYEGWLHRWRRGKWRPEDPLERAAVWFVLQQMSMSGKFGSGWSYSNIRNSSQSFYSKLNSFEAIAHRLRKVQIENLDFEEFILKWDDEWVLSYHDPPYLVEGRDTAYEYYAGKKFTIDDHRRLARLLSNIKGKAIVSYYPHPLVDELYPKEKWFREEIPVIKTSAYEPGVKDKPVGVELLLYNFEPLPLDRLLAQVQRGVCPNCQLPIEPQIKGCWRCPGCGWSSCE